MIQATSTGVLIPYDDPLLADLVSAQARWLSLPAHDPGLHDAHGRLSEQVGKLGNTVLRAVADSPTPLALRLLGASVQKRQRDLDKICGWRTPGHPDVGLARARLAAAQEKHQRLLELLDHIERQALRAG